MPLNGELNSSERIYMKKFMVVLMVTMMILMSTTNTFAMSEWGWMKQKEAVKEHIDLIQSSDYKVDYYDCDFIWYDRDTYGCSIWIKTNDGNFWQYLGFTEDDGKTWEDWTIVNDVEYPGGRKMSEISQYMSDKYFNGWNITKMEIFYR